MRKLIRIVAAGATARPEFLVAQEREARVVDLQVGAPCGREVADFLAIDAADVAPEPIEIRIGPAVDRRPPAAVIENGRRGHGELGRPVRDRPQIPEVLEHHRARATHAAPHLGRVARIVGSRELVRLLVELDLDPVDLAEKIVVPPAAAVLAVGHDLQAERLLARDRLANTTVFDRAQLPGAHFAALDLGARLLDLGRSQEAPDLVRPERRRCSRAHRPSLTRDSPRACPS